MKTIASSLLIVVASLVFAPLWPAFSQESYPGLAFFSYECHADGAIFFYENSSIIDVADEMIAQGLHNAASRGRNQLIAATSQISLWALTSSELQIHVNTRPERTKLVLPDDICGIPAYEPQPRQNSGSRAIAHASSSNGGSAVAYVEINPSGQVRVYASSSGDGVAIASVRTDGSSAGYVYVVQTGDNLFRIALENDTTVDALASLNDIEDPDTIRIGQRLVIP